MTRFRNTAEAHAIALAWDEARDRAYSVGRGREYDRLDGCVQDLRALLSVEPSDGTLDEMWLVVQARMRVAA